MHNNQGLKRNSKFYIIFIKEKENYRRNHQNHCSPFITGSMRLHIYGTLQAKIQWHAGVEVHIEVIRAWIIPCRMSWTRGHRRSGLAKGQFCSFKNFLGSIPKMGKDDIL